MASDKVPRKIKPRKTTTEDLLMICLANGKNADPLKSLNVILNIIFFLSHETKKVVQAKLFGKM